MTRPALYIWSSTYLKQYSEGQIIVMADSPEEARAKAREKLLAHLRKNRDWLFSGLTAHEILRDEDINAEKRKIETDLSKDPRISTSDVILMEGSQ